MEIITTLLGKIGFIIFIVILYYIDGLISKTGIFKK